MSLKKTIEKCHMKKGKLILSMKDHNHNFVSFPGTFTELIKVCECGAMDDQEELKEE